MVMQEVERAVKVLEGSEGVSEPTSSSLIEGRWQLMFTTRPGSASPIQALATIKDGKRILFQFDRAAFSFKFLPFKVPYPVPFRLLGDEAKGWLDTTYLSPSGNLRISRGNKVGEPKRLRATSYTAIVLGTTFVLQRETEPRQKLLSSISTGTRVEEAIEEFISLNKNVANSELELLKGEWQMIWSSQVETDSWIENAGNGLMGMQIVKPNGQLKFLVGILFGIRFSMTGKYEKSGSNTYDVIMDDGAILVGIYGIPVEMESKFTMEILYTDDKIRISRGYNKILFVHVRVDGSNKK
ncbi:putative plastid-lipid-associated protein 12, chloroplastic [Capsicum baccatum]|uniref:Plastid-lipid-associated protein 12, chloroplastic n=1 Tax=Capsicum baccatum TaxID=33114 RepID=A0A2G2XNA3_CAPBA|nr:putative plastid-lipid-associated protein 12, chloroplastic [Capsicum baccatum]